MMGVRAPGSSAEAIDVAFFGEGNPPPYEPRKGDKNLRSSAKILKTVLSALNTRSLPECADEAFGHTAVWEAQRPPLDAPDEVLLSYMLDVPETFHHAFKLHMISTAIAAIVSGVLADACAAAGEPGLVTHLIGAAGNVRSAQYANDLHAIALRARDNETVSAALDHGVDGVLAVSYTHLMLTTILLM